MKSKHLFVSGSNVLSVPVIVYYCFLGRPVTIFYLDNCQKESVILKNIALYLNIEYIKVPYMSCGTIHSDSIKASDQIINAGFLRAVIEFSSQLYQSKGIELFFKKLLAEKMIEYFFLEEYFFDKGESIIDCYLISNGYSSVCSLLNHYGYRSRVNMVNVIKLSLFSNIYSYFSFFILTIVSISNYLFYYFRKVHNMLYCNYKDKVNSYKYAFLLSDRIQVKNHGAKKYNFILDEVNINKDNSLFLVETGLDIDHLQEIKDHTIKQMPTNKSILISMIGREESFVLFRIYIDLLLNSTEEKIIAWYDILSLYFHYSKYTKFLKYNKIENFIYTNREGKSQIAINTLLSSYHIKTYCYMMFIGGQYKNYNQNTIYDKRRVIWSFLNCTHFLVNNEAMLDSMKEQYQSVDEYSIIGNISSSLIKNTTTVGIEHIIKAKEKWKRVISIFDTTYIQSDFVYSTYDEGIKFISDIVDLAKSNQDSLFVFKPAKPDKELIDPNIQWSHMEKGRIINDTRKTLSRLDNVFVLDYSIDSLSILSVSDCVITDCFSSPTADALIYGIPAFWYDALSKLKDFPFDLIDGMVIHGFESLNFYFENYSDSIQLKRIKNNKLYPYLIDSFDDNNAVTRFRKALLGEPFAKPQKRV